MESKNETVEDIVKEQHDFAVRVYGVNHAPSTEAWKLADRIEAAHRREVAELREYPNANAIGAKDMREEIAILRNMITNLSAKLKVADDALERVYQCVDNKRGIDAVLLVKRKIEDALAAIREEGGES